MIDRAAAQEDEELFISVLSGADEEWTSAQKRLFAAGQIYDRPAFGLEDGVGAAPVTPEQVSLDVELRSAVVTRPVQFTLYQPNGMAETITLELEQVYRLGNRDRWLLAPPTADYWGNNRTFNGAHMAARFPTRDSEWAGSLAERADAALQAICSRYPSLECAGQVLFTVEFSNRPEIFLSLNTAEPWQQTEETFYLPTLSLIGSPTKASDREAIEQTYLRLIVMAFVDKQLNYDCCIRGIFLQAAADHLLAQENITPTRLNPDSYRRLLNGLTDIRLDSGRPIGGPDLQLQRRSWEYAYAVVEFLFTVDGAESFGGLQRILGGTTTTLWLNNLLELEGQDRGSLDRAWFQFLALRANANRVAAPLPDAQLLCRSSSRSAFRRYQLLNGPPFLALVDENEPDYPGQPIPLPDGTGVVNQPINVTGPEEAALQVYYFDGRSFELGRLEGPPIRQLFYTGRHSPDKSKLLIFNDLPIGFESPIYSIYDLNSCAADYCQPYSVPGFGQWSPDSQRFAYMDRDDTGNIIVWLADGLGQNGVPAFKGVEGASGAPSWENDESLLFIYNNELRRYHLPTDQNELLISSEQIFASNLFEAFEGSAEIFLQQAHLIPGSTNEYLIQGRFSNLPGRNDSFMLRYNASTRAFSLIVEPKEGWFVPLQISADEKWLTIYQFEFESEFAFSEQIVLKLYHYETQRSFEYSVDASSSFLLQPVLENDDWLLLPGDSFIRYLNPLAGIEEYIFPEGNYACSGAVLASP